jgi:hypothetical protein
MSTAKRRQSNDSIENRIIFEDAAALRPDSGKNIAYAGVVNNPAHKYMDSMKKFDSQMWNDNKCLYYGRHITNKQHGIFTHKAYINPRPHTRGDGIAVVDIIDRE